MVLRILHNTILLQMMMIVIIEVIESRISFKNILCLPIIQLGKKYVASKGTHSVVQNGFFFIREIVDCLFMLHLSLHFLHVYYYIKLIENSEKDEETSAFISVNGLSRNHYNIWSCS